MATLSRFEQFSKTLVLSIVSMALVLGTLEVVSYLVLRSHGYDTNRYPYAQIISGYHIFRNTPFFSAWDEVKENPSDPPTMVDGEGFISDNPIATTKPPGTIRIFLMGGSAAFGTGQFPPYASIHPYHLGTLSYSLSPAGQLERYLQKKRPEMTFEVVNAASVDRMMHQSAIHYMESVSRYSPDIVINMDGYNDIFHGLQSGRPYAEMESRLEYYVDLVDFARGYKPYLVHLMNLGYRKYLHGFFYVRQKRMFYTNEDLEQSKYSLEAYKTFEPAFIGTSQRFLQILDHYMAVLKSDQVDFIFTVQPILYRQINKEWSPIEDRMRKTAFGLAPNTPEELKTQYILLTKFFFDEYLSQASMERVQRQGFGFLDMNREISKLKSDFEFYIDYCHFTIPGSRAVAEILGDEVLRRMDAKKTSH